MDQTHKIIEFTLVYNKHKKGLFNYVLKMIYDKMACEDIIQNVFLKLFENMDKIRNAGSMQYWLFTTARNEVFTYFRNKRIRVDQFYVQDSDEIDVLSNDHLDIDYEQKELKDLINSELERMAFEQREVFLLKEYGGLSYKEIAAMMKIDEELVKSRLFKTRQRLIKRLSKILQNS